MLGVENEEIHILGDDDVAEDFLTRSETLLECLQEICDLQTKAADAQQGDKKMNKNLSKEYEIRLVEIMEKVGKVFQELKRIRHVLGRSGRYPDTIQQMGDHIELCQRAYDSCSGQER